MKTQRHRLRSNFSLVPISFHSLLILSADPLDGQACRKGRGKSLFKLGDQERDLLRFLFTPPEALLSILFYALLGIWGQPQIPKKGHPVAPGGKIIVNRRKVYIYPGIHSCSQKESARRSLPRCLAGKKEGRARWLTLPCNHSAKKTI